MKTQIIELFLFGFGLAISIGPITIAIVNKCLSEGYKAGILCSLGASLGDFTFAFFAYNCHQSVIEYLNVSKYSIHLFSTTILILFGLYLMYSSISSTSLQLHQKNKAGINLLSIYLLSLSNPISIVAFFALFGQINADTVSVTNGFLFSFAIFSGSIIAELLSIFIIWCLTQGLTESHYKKLNSWSNIVSGAIIICFGFTLLGS